MTFYLRLDAVNLSNFITDTQDLSTCVARAWSCSTWSRS